MKKKLLILLLSLFFIVGAQAQQSPERRQRLRELLVQRFDSNGDGQLSDEERQRARQALKARKGAQASASAKKTVSGLYGQVEPQSRLVQKDLELYDSARQKKVPFQVTYPEGQGKLPVVVWSHGLFGSQDYYQPLVSHWARHGYLVIQPSHSDSVERGQGRISQGYSGSIGDWASRPQDVTFLLNSLPLQKEVAARADLTRVGMGGHSFGAHTTMLLEGAQPTAGRSYLDPRPKAFVAISPQGESRLFNSDSWSGLARPTLFVSGDNDDNPDGHDAQWRLDPYRGCPPGQKYLLWVKDAHHNFGGISGRVRSGSGPSDPDQVEIVKAATLAFWDVQLKGSASGRQVLQTGELGPRADDLYRWESK